MTFSLIEENFNDSIEFEAWINEDDVPVMVSASRVLAEEVVKRLRGAFNDCRVALVDDEIFRVVGVGRAVFSGLVGPTSSTAASLDAVATSGIVSPSLKSKTR